MSKGNLVGVHLLAGVETPIDTTLFFSPNTDFNDESMINFSLYNAVNEQIHGEVKGMTVNGVRMNPTQRYQLPGIDGYFAFQASEDEINVSHYADHSSTQRTPVTAEFRISEVATTSGMLHYDENVKANIKFVRGAADTLVVAPYIERTPVVDKVKAPSTEGGIHYFVLEGEYAAQLVAQNITAVPSATLILTGSVGEAFYIGVYGNYGPDTTVEVFAEGVKLFSYDVVV